MINPHERHAQCYSVPGSPSSTSGSPLSIQAPEARCPKTAGLVPRLEAGGVYVNGASPVTGCELPFGGVGISGFGREGGLEGLLEFVRTKAVAIA